MLGDRAVPAIAVTINGRRGVFYLSSKLNSVIGSMDDQFESAYVPADVSIQFPGSYLHSGTNSIALEVLRVDEPSNLPAGLNYDAIELDSSQATPASALSVHPADGLLQTQRRQVDGACRCLRAKIVAQWSTANSTWN